MTRKIISIVLSFGLLFQQGGLVYAAGELNLANYLSSMHSAITQPDRFQPARLRYISYDSQNNDFRLLLDKGNIVGNGLEPFPTQQEEAKLFNYFLIGLALPNDTFWVNLRPDAADNIIDPILEKTDIGKIFLEADLQLKKDTASLTSPQTLEGKQYWDKLYKKAGELFGTENITIPTITRPWIVPNEVIVRETEDSAYIYKATLKVMLEEDYLRGMKDDPAGASGRGTINYSFNDPRLKELNEYSTRIIRETIIPKLTKEVNSSKRYAQLRQVYYSLVLSRWFKQKYSSLGSARASEHQSIGARGDNYVSLINSGNLANLASKESYDKQTYFQAYQKSFKDGEYNLKETVSTPFGQSIRSYVSGGIRTEMEMSIVGSPVREVTKELNADLVDPSTVSTASPLEVKELIGKGLKGIADGLEAMNMIIRALVADHKEYNSKMGNVSTYLRDVQLAVNGIKRMVKPGQQEEISIVNILSILEDLKGKLSEIEKEIKMLENNPETDVSQDLSSLSHTSLNVLSRVKRLYKELQDYTGSQLTAISVLVKQFQGFLDALESHSKSYNYNAAIPMLIDTIKQQIELIKENKFFPVTIKIGKSIIEKEWEYLCEQMPGIKITLSLEYNNVMKEVDKWLTSHSEGTGSPLTDKELKKYMDEIRSYLKNANKGIISVFPNGGKLQKQEIVDKLRGIVGPIDKNIVSIAKGELSGDKLLSYVSGLRNGLNEIVTRNLPLRLNSVANKGKEEMAANVSKYIVAAADKAEELYEKLQNSAGSPIGVRLSQDTPDNWMLVRFGDLSEPVKSILLARTQDVFPEVRISEIVTDNDAFVVELNYSGGIERVLGAWIRGMSNGIYLWRDLKPGSIGKTTINNALDGLMRAGLPVVGETITAHGINGKEIELSYVKFGDLDDYWQKIVKKKIADGLSFPISGGQNIRYLSSANQPYINELRFAVIITGKDIIIKGILKTSSKKNEDGLPEYFMADSRSIGIALQKAWKEEMIAAHPIFLTDEEKGTINDIIKKVDKVTEDYTQWQIQYGGESLVKNMQEYRDEVLEKTEHDIESMISMMRSFLQDRKFVTKELEGCEKQIKEIKNSIKEKMREEFKKLSIGEELKESKVNRFNMHLENNWLLNAAVHVSQVILSEDDPAVGKWKRLTEDIIYYRLGSYQTTSSPAIASELEKVVFPKKPIGGIDLTDRALQIKLERGGSFASTPLLLPQVKNAQNLDLDKEFEQIESLASSGIVPNSHRLLELFTVCHYRGEFGQRLNQIISCLKASSAIQEAEAIDSDEDFRLALMMPEVLS